MQPKEKVYLKEYLKSNGTDIAWDFIHESMRSVSGTAMIMFQVRRRRAPALRASELCGAAAACVSAGTGAPC